MKTDKIQDKTLDAINPAVVDAVRKKSIGNKISCEEAVRIATELSESTKDVGTACDLLKISLTECQLGFFGFEPQKKIIMPDQSVAPELEKAIRDKLLKGTLPCAAAWKIAEKMALPRMKVASACQALKIKVTPCQLGAF